jgi:hypothetical protein
MQEVFFREPKSNTYLLNFLKMDNRNNNKFTTGMIYFCYLLHKGYRLQKEYHD